MALTEFYDEMGKLGALISNEFGADMGISCTYSHASGATIPLVGFVRGTRVTKELVLAIMSAGQRIDFFFGKQVSFPPTDGIAQFDQITWIPSVTGIAIDLVIEDFEDVASMGQMFRLKCFYAQARQLGQVGG